MAGSDVKLISCRICGVIMVMLSRDVCPKCHQVEEQAFSRVREVIRTKPGLSIAEIAKESNCPEEQINYFISSGRLERIGAEIAHPCQTCGKTIMTGLICPECSRVLKDKVSELQSDIDRKKNEDENPGSKKKEGFHVGKPRN